MRGETLAVTGRPVVHLRNQDQTGIIGQPLRRSPGVRADNGRPGSVGVSAMIVVADDVTIFLLFEWPLRLVLNKIIGNTRATDHPFAASITNDGVARDRTKDR